MPKCKILPTADHVVPSLQHNLPLKICTFKNNKHLNAPLPLEPNQLQRLLIHIVATIPTKLPLINIQIKKTKRRCPIIRNILNINLTILMTAGFDALERLFKDPVEIHHILLFHEVDFFLIDVALAPAGEVVVHEA